MDVFRNHGAASKETSVDDGAAATQGVQLALKPAASPYDLESSEESSEDDKGEQEGADEVVPTKEDKEVLEHARQTGIGLKQVLCSRLKPC